MKRSILMGIALVAILVSGALAGDYHSGATLLCNECHIMHYSQTHGYTTGTGGATLPALVDGPHHYLLRQGLTDLCLACHDGQGFAPDVLNANGGTAQPNGRQAGALNDGTEAEYNVIDGHTLGSTSPAPGGTWASSHEEGFTCIDCHHQHGSTTGITRTITGSAYRNLYSRAGGTAGPNVSYIAGITNDPTRDVWVQQVRDYDMQSVRFNEPALDSSYYGNWCKQCHTVFHGNASDANMKDQAATGNDLWYRHPTAQANVGSIGGGHSNLGDFNSKAYKVQFLSSTGAWGTWGTTGGADGTATPSCMSCHKAHGNQRPFGLIWTTGNANPGEDGDGASYQAVCGQCHVQA